MADVALAVATAVVLALTVGILLPDRSVPATTRLDPRPVGLQAPATVGEPVPPGPSPGQTGEPPPVPTPATPAPRSLGSWAELLDGLDERRSAAFAEVDPALLTEVYAPGSAPLAEEQERLAVLARAGVRADGLRLVVDAVVGAEVTGTTARLEVVDHMPAYRLVDTVGATLEERAERTSRRWSVTLVHGPDGWRIAATAPLSG